MQVVMDTIVKVAGEIQLRNGDDKALGELLARTRFLDVAPDPGQKQNGEWVGGDRAGYLAYWFLRGALLRCLKPEWTWTPGRNSRSIHTWETFYDSLKLLSSLGFCAHSVVKIKDGLDRFENTFSRLVIMDGRGKYEV